MGTLCRDLDRNPRFVWRFLACEMSPLYPFRVRKVLVLVSNSYEFDRCVREEADRDVRWGFGVYKAIAESPSRRDRYVLSHQQW